MANEDALQFPSDSDKGRLDQYTYYDQLYMGDQYKAFHIKAGKKMEEAYSALRYLAVPIPGLISRTLADMLFGEDITIDVDDDQTQKFLSKVIDKNHLIAQLYESELVNSRRGDAVFKIRVGKRNPLDTNAIDEVIIEEFPAKYYFPQFDMQSARYTPSSEVVAFDFMKDKVCYLHKETYAPGYIYHEVWEYDKEAGKLKVQVDPAIFGIQEVEETGLDYNPLFHIPNVRDGNGFFGTSDYIDLIPFFFAANNRMTKIDNVLDKHSDPVLAVPPGVIDDEGKVIKEALGVFQVDTDNPGFNKPEYIVWDANMEASFKQIDKIMEMAQIFADIPPAATGTDKNGLIESGRALKFKLLSAIRKRNRKISYYDPAIRDMLYCVQELALDRGLSAEDEKMGKLEMPTIKWGDGIINDQVEMVDVAEKRINIGISSKADEISRIDGISIDDAKEKVKEIEEENAPDLTALDANAQATGTGTTTTMPMNTQMQNAAKPPVQK